MVGWVARKTIRVRHFLVRVIAPKLYKDAKEKHALTRPMIEFVKECLEGKSLVGVEIGVAEGTNAENMLETLFIQKLYLIDPYTPHLQDGKPRDTQYCFPIAKEKLSKFKEKVEFILKKSSEAVGDVPDELDFVYIDGNHTYEFVKKDIELYYPKVRKGGVIGGHDFMSEWLGVCKAVFEFANKNNLKIHGRKSDWWFVKN